MNTQPEALRLADELARVARWSDSEHWDTLNEAAAELHRLHALNDDLLAALQTFPGFTDNATVGDAWVETMRATIAKATGG